MAMLGLIARARAGRYLDYRLLGRGEY